MGAARGAARPINTSRIPSISERRPPDGNLSPHFFFLQWFKEIACKAGERWEVSRLSVGIIDCWSSRTLYVCILAGDRWWDRIDSGGLGEGMVRIGRGRAEVGR